MSIESAGQEPRRPASCRPTVRRIEWRIVGIGSCHPPDALIIRGEATLRLTNAAGPGWRLAD
jgi:hypothetical protein